MSATLEAEQYADFFADAAIVRVPGRRFPVQVMYTRESQRPLVYQAFSC
jgi:HrpA-like RNA helicase